MIDAGRRLASLRGRLWPTVIGLTAIAFAAALRNRPGQWIGDNRFELYANPEHRIDGGLVIWDVTRGLGRIREEFWPAITLVIAFFRAVGFDEATTQHLWHGVLLALGGVGIVQLMRIWHPAIDLAHWAAALIWMFGPFSVAFLLPSNVYTSYAAAPWLMFFVLRGIRQPSRWNMPAAIALTIAAIGNVDYAGLLFVVVFAVVAGILEVVASRTPPRALWQLGWRTAALALPANAAALYKTLLAAEVFEQRVRDTETPAVIFSVSSWSESFRGLGSWLLYIQDRSGATRPQTALYLTNDWVVIATFVLPVLAVIGLALGAKGRGVLGGVMLLGALIMVGDYPAGDTPGAGSVLAWARNNVPQLGGLRNGYKAGSGLTIGVAALSGLTIQSGWSAISNRVSRPEIRSASRLLVATAAFGTLALVSQPFWRGPLFNPIWELDEVPTYVDEFAAWMNDQDEGHRALVTPGSTRNGFRWGWLNDDYLDAMIERPQVTDTLIELSRPVSADLLHAYDATMGTSAADGLTAELARRIGADLVVIRNDHQWEIWGQPPPAALDVIRDDPNLRRVATFGEPGQFTVSGFDVSTDGDRARQLPPIEVYQVVDPRPIVDVRNNDLLIVSGAGDALDALHRSGMLGDRSIRYSATMTSDELTTALGDGAPLLITDTNQRREVAISLDRLQSWTLPAEGILERPLIDLFQTAGSESVADYGDAADLVPSSTALRFQPHTRPGLAFDGLASTAWQVGVGRTGRAESLRVVLDGPMSFSGIETWAAALPNGPLLVAAQILLSDGSTGELAFDDEGYARSAIEAQNVDWVEITLIEIDGVSSGLIGLSEIRLGELQIREAIQVPRDVVLRATDDPALNAAVDAASIGWVFASSPRASGEPAERMVRRFQNPQPAGVEARGELRVDANADDELLAELAGGTIAVTSSSRSGAALTGWAGRAFDGDEDTGWIAPARAGESLLVELGEIEVESVQILVDLSANRSPITELSLSIGDQIVGSSVEASCVGETDCVRWVELTLDDVERADTIRVTVEALTSLGVSGRIDVPISIREVRVNGKALVGLFGDPLDRCHDGLMHIDDVAVPVELDISIAALLDGDQASFRTCAPVTVGSGDHIFAAAPGAAIESIVLAPAELLAPSPPADPQPVAPVVAKGPTGWSVEVPPGSEGYLTIGQSYDRRWTAELDGTDLGDPISIDTQTAWALPAGASGTVEVRFPPQRTFRGIVILSVITWAVAAAVLYRSRVT